MCALIELSGAINAQPDGRVEGDEIRLAVFCDRLIFYFDRIKGLVLLSFYTPQVPS